MEQLSERIPAPPCALPEYTASKRQWYRPWLQSHRPLAKVRRVPEATEPRSALRRFLWRNTPPGLSSRLVSTLWQPAYGATWAGCRCTKTNQNPAPAGLFFSGNRLRSPPSAQPTSLSQPRNSHLDCNTQLYKKSPDSCSDADVPLPFLLFVVVIIAPSKARRLLPGESPGRVRASHPPISSVSPAAELCALRKKFAGQAYIENPVGRRVDRAP
jgi:hypothetical protein